ncbi:BatA domain-containing protein [Zavarzinella formosa]|uniref:BatA domain-containing protein n=1 Tax=Zavarzinella formosa TaxID=360055 RepID=UPI0002EB105A|nr:BatA domain-containing protein [Zavarzinella formosa]
MGFLASSMLFGVAAAGIPLALHFFYRARYKPVPWGAMQFLKLAVEQTSRRLRFQELILLLLRILVVALLAMALSRPVMCSGVTAGNRGEAVDAVFIIDISYSMNAQENITRLEMAKQAALKVTDDLPPNSTVQVITTTDRAVAAGPKSPRNLDQAKLLIQNLKSTAQSTDYLAGFTEAVSAFARAEGNAKEAYLFSDMSRGGWERQSAAIRAKCEELKAIGTLYLVRCGGQSIKNVSILDLRPQTDIPHTGSRMPFTVIVKNTSSETVNGLTVTLKVDGKPLDKDAQPIEKLGPGETKPVTLTGKIDEAGWRVLTAEVKSDQLADDNTLDRVILVREKVRVLVIDGSPNDREPEKAGSFFVGHALLPVPEEYRLQYHVRPTIVKASDVSPGMLADQEVCIMLNVPLGGAGALPADVVQRLGEFVREGHGLFVSSGPNVEKNTYNRVLGPTGADLLPIELGDVYEAAKDKPFFPDPNSIDLQSFLARFRLSANDPFLQIREAFVQKALQTVEPQGEQAKAAGRVLMRFNDGKPALISKRVGEGEVLFLTTSLDKDWGFFATNLTFQPFIHGAMTHLIERSTTGYNKIAGESIRYSPKDATKTYQVIRPDGTKETLGKPVGGANEQLALTIPSTSQAGIYTIVESGAETGVRFAVAPDLRESETMDPLPDSQIDDLLGFKPEHLNSGEEASQKADSVRNRNEWTITVLLMVLLLAGLETGFAWFCGKAW